MLEIKKYKTLFDSNDKPYIIDEDGSIIATSSQIGFVYNEGPPHDHNRNWVDSRYLEDLYYPRFISEMKDMDGYVYLVVKQDEMGTRPTFHHDMVIMDLYGLLKSESGILIHK